MDQFSVVVLFFHAAWEILAPQPVTEPRSVRVQSPNHRTARKFPHFLPNVHFLMGKKKAVIGRTFLTYVAC